MIEKINERTVVLTTKKHALVLQFSHVAEIAYLGENTHDVCGLVRKESLYNRHASSDALDMTPSVFSSWSDGGDLEPMIKLVDEKGIYVQRFTPVGFDIVDNFPGEFPGPHSRDKKQTLVISYLDETKRLLVEQYISTHHQSEGIVFSLKIKNIGKTPFVLVKAKSLQLDFLNTDNTLYTFDGAWCRERHLHQTDVKTGLFCVKTASGLSSNVHNPFVILRNENLYIGSNLIYSGSHGESIEALPLGKSRFLTGLNEDVFSYDLAPQEEFITPEAVITIGTSLEDVQTKMHEFVRNNILPAKKNTGHVLLNSWEGIYFDFDRKKILNLAKVAKDVGVDLFVLDDGWFGRRDDDTTSLGDWFDYEEKTGGLASLVNDIKGLGLKFGLWFEPEMISQKSQLFEKHPSFAMVIPGITPIERRQQLMLDFSSAKVRDYIFTMMSKVIDKLQPDYLKLDANRYMSDIYSPILKNQGEYQHRYVLGLYDFWNRLVTRYPQILIEACSSGGNRFDLGTLYYFPQIWASDNTDALSRIYIQEGTLHGYPQSTFGSHVSQTPNTLTKRSTPLESRFNIASIGAFGYEMDLTKLSDQELKTIKAQIDFYKEHAPLLLHGIYTQLSSAFTSPVYAYLIKDQRENFKKAILLVAVTDKEAKNLRLPLSGFATNRRYRIVIRNQDNLPFVSVVYKTGHELNKTILNLDHYFAEELGNEKNDTIASRLFVIERIDEDARNKK
ncbi:MAG: alpha-galactosidase [Bacilli bacterium]